jgi:hypothetical protein
LPQVPDHDCATTHKGRKHHLSGHVPTEMGGQSASGTTDAQHQQIKSAGEQLRDNDAAGR